MRFPLSLQHSEAMSIPQLDALPTISSSIVCSQHWKCPSCGTLLFSLADKLKDDADEPWPSYLKVVSLMLWLKGSVCVYVSVSLIEWLF